MLYQIAQKGRLTGFNLRNLFRRQAHLVPEPAYNHNTSGQLFIPLRDDLSSRAIPDSLTVNTNPEYVSSGTTSEFDKSPEQEAIKRVDGAVHQRKSTDAHADCDRIGLGRWVQCLIWREFLWIGVLGQIFMAFLKMVVVPLIFCSIVVAIASIAVANWDNSAVKPLVLFAHDRAGRLYWTAGC